MIDFHTHILPGIDDGSEDLEMTRCMLEEQSRQGVQAVVATPHFFASKMFPEEFLQQRAAALEQVASLQGQYPKIIPGAEVAYFFGMGGTGVLQDLQLGDSGLLLVEMPFCPWTQRMVEEICDLPQQTGLTPVLAHVDRYRHRKQLPRHMKFLLEQGVLFQCNTRAFLHADSRRWALKMLKKGHIHFLGSDTHSPDTRPPNMELAAQIITKRLGEEVLTNLTAFTAKMLKL